MRIPRFAGILAFVSVVLAAMGSQAVAANEAADRDGALTKREWTVNGIVREALVYLPTDAKKPAPTVFVFHGHGGNSSRSAQMFKIHKLWPEAIVVYPQGLNTPGRLTDPDGKKPGWQSYIGDQDDRDLKFFDAMLKSLREEKRVDDKRVYATGHSNGGGFTYVLLAARGDELAAVAPSGALETHDVKDIKPKPVFHVAGKNDPLVKFEWQERMTQAIRKINQCDPKGEKQGDSMTRYESKLNTPLVTYFFDGGHAFPPEAGKAVVEFFKSQVKSTH